MKREHNELASNNYVELMLTRRRLPWCNDGLKKRKTCIRGPTLIISSSDQPLEINTRPYENKT